MSFRNNSIFKFVINNSSFLYPLIITTTTYCVAWRYLDSYFHVFGLSLKSLHLSNIYYFQSYIVVIQLGISLALLFFLYLLHKIKVKNYHIAFQKNNYKLYLFINYLSGNTDSTLLAALIIIILFITWVTKNHSNHFVLSTILILGLIAIFIFISKVIKIFKRPKSNQIILYFNFKKESKPLIDIAKFLIILLIIITISYSFDTGSKDAVKTIQGKSKYHSLVSFTFKTTYKEEQIKVNIENKELIFITYTNDSYYLVERNNNFDIDKDIPNIYVIPKEEIKIIKIKKIRA